MSILLLNTLKTGYIRLTLFFPMFPFDPTENIRKPKVFWCFQGGSKGYTGKKRVKTFACKLMRYMKNIAIIKLYLYLVYLPSCVSCAPSFVAWQANNSRFLGWTIHANLINNPEYIHNAKRKKGITRRTAIFVIPVILTGYDSAYLSTTYGQFIYLATALF